MLDELKRKYPCIVGPNLAGRTKIELKTWVLKSGVIKKWYNGCNYDRPSCNSNPVSCSCAALSVKYGMDEYEALKAITIHPAKILGIDDRVGSIEKGKDADIVIMNGHPFDTFSTTHMVL